MVVCVLIEGTPAPSSLRSGRANEGLSFLVSVRKGAALFKLPSAKEFLPLIQDLQLALYLCVMFPCIYLTIHTVMCVVRTHGWRVCVGVEGYELGADTDLS